MTIIEKHYQGLKLTGKESEKEKVLFLNYLADLKVLCSSLPESKRDIFNKTLSLILIYFPSQWKEVIFKQLTPEIIEKLVKEEQEGEY